MTSGLYTWSTTAGTNASADSSINFAEGMAPSAVNDSARALMARVAEWRNDISGTITTGGTATAYTVASGQVFDTLAHMNGAMIAFVPHATNGATVTLNVDGLGAKPLRFGPSLELQDGVLIQGTPYVATYNNSDAAFYLQGGFANPYGIPIGGLLPYLGTSAPSAAFVLPFGQAISRSTYAKLFTQISTTFGAGDGSTTFNVPDLRGRVCAGLDNMGGSAASRIGTVVTDSATIVGTTLGSVGGSSTHAQTTSELRAHTHTDSGHTHTIDNVVSTGSLTFGAGGAPQIGGSQPTTLTSNSGSANLSTTGGSTAMAWLQPTMMVGMILRVI